MEKIAILMVLFLYSSFIMNMSLNKNEFEGAPKKHNPVKFVKFVQCMSFY